MRCGGGANHRFGLDDAILIKDNHIAVAGGVNNALRAAKDFKGHLVKIEIEVDTLEQLREVLAEGADVVLLDNMSLGDLREAVAMIGGRMITEASGGVTLETIAANRRNRRRSDFGRRADPFGAGDGFGVWMWWWRE